MKIIQSLSRIGGAVLVLSLLLTIGIAFSSTAQAQYPNDRNAQGRDRNGDQDRDRNGDQDRGRNWDRYGNYGGSTDLRQTALEQGYNEGIKQGQFDRNQTSRSDYHNQSSYQSGMMGYRRRFGDRDLYRRYFREAFESGYNSEVNTQGRRGRDDRDDRGDRSDRDRNRDRNDNNDQTHRGRNWDGYGNFGGSAQLRQTALNAGYNEGNKQGRNDRNRGDGNYQNQGEYRKATKDYSSGLGDREIYRRYFREAYKTGYNDGLNGS